MLDREEYVEQAYLYRCLAERLPQNLPMQECLRQIKEELLASAKLPMAVDYLRSELEHAGALSPAMTRLGHYFTPFQTFIMQEAENERGRFDLRTALEILRSEAEYRAAGASPQGLLVFQFEILCRNRLKYDPGFAAMAADPWYDEAWRDWIQIVRRQVGIIDFADLVYVRSQYYHQRRESRAGETLPPEKPLLFGEKEGKIAWANRQKDPLFFFAAMQRHLGYPTVPRPKPVDDSPQIIPTLMRRVERLEQRIKLMEEEQRDGAFDITRFYGEHPDAGGPRRDR
jgi:hypothetical protein